MNAKKRGLMIEYKVTNDGEGNFVIRGNFAVGSIPVNIPEEDPCRLKYISFFIHKTNIEFGIDCLHCISLDKHPTVNKALFLSALASIIKCFQKSNKYILLSESKFKKTVSEHIYSEYKRFKNWRNKHYLHEENNMTEATAFLLVAPEGSNMTLGGLPSVVWNTAKVNFIAESKKLEEVMQEAWKFVANNIDKLGDYYIEKYGKEPREKLLSYGEPMIELAKADDENNA